MKWIALVAFLSAFLSCFGQELEQDQTRASAQRVRDKVRYVTKKAVSLPLLEHQADKPQLSTPLNNPVGVQRRRPRMRSRDEIMRQYRSFHEKFDKHPSLSHKNSTTSRNSTNSITKSYSVTRISQPLQPNSRQTNDSCQLLDATTNIPRNHHILLFVDTKFYPLYHNWHLHFLDVCGTQRLNHLELVCMDNQVALQLANIGMKCSPHSFVMDIKGLYHTKKQALVWLKRLEVVIFYLEHGVDLILSDTDAIWRADPFVDINRYYNEAQIIASKGSFPHTLHSLWGATICMGYVFFRASPFTVRFMQEVLADMQSRSSIMERIQEEVTYLQSQRLNALSVDEHDGNEAMAKEWNSTLNNSSIDRYRRDAMDKETLSRQATTVNRHRNLRSISPSSLSPAHSTIHQQRSLADSEHRVGEEDGASKEEEEDNEEDGSNGSNKSLFPVKQTAPDDAPGEYSMAFHTFLTRLSPVEAVQAYNQALQETQELLLTGNHSDIQRRIPLFSIREQEGYKPDDQYSANYLLHRLQVQWSRSPMPIIEGDVFTVDRGIMHAAFMQTNSNYTSRDRLSTTLLDTKETFAIVLLAHAAYPRNCTGVPFERRTRSLGVVNARHTVGKAHVVVAHCVIAPGDAYKKYLSLRSYRLWHRDAPRLRAVDYGGFHSVWRASEKAAMSPRITVHIHDSLKDEAQVLADPAFQAFARQWQNVARGRHAGSHKDNSTESDGNESTQEILWMLQAMEPGNHKPLPGTTKTRLPKLAVATNSSSGDDVHSMAIEAKMKRDQRRGQLRERATRRRKRLRERQASASLSEGDGQRQVEDTPSN